ncbi:MAG: TonB-dependent receptor [Bacteroidota bacterium]
MRLFLCCLLFCLPLTYFGQEITGTVLDASNGSPLTGVKITGSEGQKALSDPDGNFRISYGQLPFRLVFEYASFYPDTLTITENKPLTVSLSPKVLEKEMVVVSSARRGQKVEEAPVSLEILKPELINNKGITDLEKAVDQSPGVYAMDGQVSIRGGSGFAYGAGSRVLLLWNGIPMLSGDAGDAKWNTIPLESISQVEVLKGASSVLYGSGALNGIISLTEKEPAMKGETRVKLQHGIYGDPKRESLKYWNRNPTFQLLDFYTGKQFRRVGYTFSLAGFTDKGYRQGETEQRVRTSGSVFFRFQKVKNLKAGIGYNFQIQKTGNFIIWQSDSLAYTPAGGADTTNDASTLTFNRGIRFSLDPYVKYMDARRNLHVLKTRLYWIGNVNYNNLGQNSLSQVYYADYQFQKKWEKGSVLTAGSSFTQNRVNSSLYGDHHSDNAALYAQFEHKWKKLYVTSGLRFEYFEQDGKRGDSDYYFGKDSARIPVFPVFRLGTNYKLFKYTFLRASYGQGVRYPSVAERYTQTSVGSLNIFANPLLQREVGWAAEAGVKQGVRIGDWKGFLDLAGFINEYENMMEFTFGFYLPDSIPPSINPASPGYIPKWFGFKAQNAERARITGLEFSFNCEGKIREVDVTALIGYTYMNPISLNTDSAYRATFSDTTANMLKYRFRHLAKADVEAKWKSWSLGASFRYNSYMSNIDVIFETKSAGVEILPGLKEYRQAHNKGVPVCDVRFGYEFKEKLRLGFIVNNFLNAEYMTRPGDIQAPRSFIVQLQLKF